jgi:hypothetical protein
VGRKKQEMASVTIRHSILFIHSRHQRPLPSFCILSNCRYIMFTFVFFPQCNQREILVFNTKTCWFCLLFKVL